MESANETGKIGKPAISLRHINFEGKGRIKASGSRRFAGDRAANSADSNPTDAACAFSRWVLDKAGMEGSIYRGTSLRRRMPACLRVLKVRSEDEARKLLTERPDLIPEALEAILIGATGFFRDPDVFKCFRNGVLPGLAANGGLLRIWSAGCSTGGELFSLAMILAESNLLERSHLLGSDCRSLAIDRCRKAHYGPADLEPVEEAMRARYFQAEGSRWQPIASLRQKVQWKTADLARHVEPGPWNVILWRNMAIYLNPGPAAVLWRRIYGELAPGGYLFVGKAERPPADLNLQAVCRQIYRKSNHDR